MVTSARDQKANDSRQRDEFIAMLSHELLGSMGPIDNTVTAAKAYCAGNENALVLLGIAERQLSRLRTLMDDLLDAVRLQHGKLRLDIKNGAGAAKSIFALHLAWQAVCQPRTL
jgi:signal transduction histidine kinase